MTDRFLICLPFTLAQECPFPNDWTNFKNFSNDPHDRGGATMCGIIQREYDSYRKRKSLPVQSVKLITQQEGQEIYSTEYWLPYCPMLDVGLDLSFFDTSVNEGTHEAVKILQFALHIPVDGMWGSQTQAAVMAIANSTAIVVSKFTARRAAVYRMMPSDQYFDKDWQRRTSEIGATSATMAEAV